MVVRRISTRKPQQPVHDLVTSGAYVYVRVMDSGLAGQPPGDLWYKVQIEVPYGEGQCRTHLAEGPSVEHAMNLALTSTGSGGGEEGWWAWNPEHPAGSSPPARRVVKRRLAT